MRVVTLFLMCLAVAVCMNAAGERRLSVPEEYASIRAAIDAAVPGDIVEVGPGIYEEAFIVKAAIELRGAGPDRTIVRAPSKYGALLKVIDVAGGSVSGFRFEHSDVSSLEPNRINWPDTVEVNNSSIEIRNCILGPSAGCGIVLQEKSNSHVVECRAEGNSQTGIFVRGEGTTATLLRNECVNNEWGGICLTKGASAVAEENICFNNNRWGVRALGKGTSAVLKNNTFAGNRGPGVLIDQWAQSVAEGNTCRENDAEGILYKLGANGAIVGNTVESNAWNGIVVQSLRVNVEVRNNTCNANGYSGIQIRTGAGSDVTGNTCNGNTWSGIAVTGWFSNAIVKDNECSENGTHGVVFNWGSSGKAEGNVCRRNTWHGIVVVDEKTEAEIGENVCEDNGLENVAQLEGEPISRQDQVDTEEVGCALAGEHFDAIETMAGLLRQHKCLYSSGGWQLPVFYEGLKKGCGDISPDNREGFTDLMERWKRAYPESVTPLIVQAEVHSGYGWKARGGGYANTVTDEGWRVFHKELGIARDYLLEAEALQGNDPHLYRLMIDVGNGLGDSSRELQAIFEKGIAIDTGYFPLYYARAWTLTHRWGGRRGELERFFEKAYELTQEEYGFAMYALLVGALAVRMGVEDFVADHSFDWAKIDKGSIAVIELFPYGNYYLNQYCLLACIYREQEKAKTLFDQIGGNIEDSVWRSRPEFRKWKQWAFDMGPAPYRAPSGIGRNRSTVGDALPNEAAFNFDRVVGIGGAVVFVLSMTAIVFLLCSAWANSRKPSSLPETSRPDECKDDEMTGE